MSSRYPHVGGILHMSNAVPGQAFQHPSPTFPAQICYCLRFTSNYEAIEKLILRPPLKVDRSLPPEVVVWYFSSSKSLTPGGKPVPYQGFQFRGNTEFNGVKGCAGWDMYFVPIDGDTFEMAIKRHGTTLIKMTMGMGAELNRSVIDSMISNPNNPFSKKTLTAREIPNEDYTQYLDQSVLVSPTAGAVKVNGAWEGKDATIESGLLESDPLTELQPGKIESAMIVNMQTNNEVFIGMKLLAKLQ